MDFDPELIISLFLIDLGIMTSSNDEVKNLNEASWEYIRSTSRMDTKNDDFKKCMICHEGTDFDEMGMYVCSDKVGCRREERVGK